MTTTYKIHTPTNTLHILRPFDAEWVKEELRQGRVVLAIHKGMGISVITSLENASEKHGFVCSFSYAGEGSLAGYGRDTCEQAWAHFTHTLTILPALPRHPKPEDAADLYRFACLYAASGLKIFGDYKKNGCSEFKRTQIALNERGSVGFSEYGRVDPIWDDEAFIITHALTADGQRVEVPFREEV